MKASMEVIKDNITPEKITAIRSLDVLWKRSIKKLYQSYQMERWMTSNWGEWKPLTSEKYIAWKAKSKTVFRMGEEYPMLKGGRQLMIASGILADSLTLHSMEYAREVATPDSIEVYTSVPYAKYVNKERSYKKYSPEFKAEVKRLIRKYLNTSMGGR